MTLRYYKIYIGMILFWGFLFIYFTPPMQNPDENTHFFNAYAISNFDFFADTAGEDGQIGRWFPKAVGDFADYYQFFFDEQDNKISYQVTQTEWSGDYDKRNVEFKSYWNADTHPIAYLIPAAGMWFFQRAGVSVTPYNLLIVGRISNLILFTLLSAAAIAVTPRLKGVLCLLCLMPSTLTLAASLNYDALLIPAVLFLFAVVMKLYVNNEPVKKSEKIFLVFVSVVLMSVKQAYFPLLLIAFAIPWERFGTKKTYWHVAVSCCVCAVLVYLVYKIPSNWMLNAAKKVNPLYSGQEEQIKYILLNSLKIPGIIVNSFLRKGQFYVNSFFGNLGNFSILFMPTYEAVYYVLLILMIILDIIRGPYTESNKKLKILLFVGIVSSMLLIFMGTYIIWTSVQVGIGADWVDGVQGRYFIMLIPFVAALFGREKKRLKGEREINMIRSAGIIEREVINIGLVYANICLTIAFVSVLLRYWI